MKRVKKGVFLVRKGFCTISNKVKIRKIREKRGKILKTWSMTKKRSSEIFAAKMDIFFRKIPHLGRRKIFPSPLKLGARFPPLLAGRPQLEAMSKSWEEVGFKDRGH